jgi:hypothetical protein
MFSRVTYESWHTIVPLIAFAATVFVFGIMTVRGFLLRKDHAEHLSKLPLDD